MKKLNTLFLLFFIASCGPAYNTSYELVAPATKKGQACADQCLVTRVNCEKTCDMDETQCMARERLAEKQSEMSYVTVRGSGSAKTPVVVNQSRPARYFNCRPDNCKTACMEAYHQCYTGCGGKVIPHSYCTAFCN